MIFVLCFALIFMVIAYPNIQEGKYFSVRALARHFTQAFPEFPDLSGDFFTATSDVLVWGHALIEWLFSFDPWMQTPPSYLKSEVTA